MLAPAPVAIALPDPARIIQDLETRLGCTLSVRDDRGVFDLPPRLLRHRRIPVCGTAFCRRRCVAHCRHATHRRCLAATGAFRQECWKGVVEIVVPLVRDEQLHGCLFAGSWRGRRIAAELPADLRQRIGTLPVLSTTRARSIAGMLGWAAHGLLDAALQRPPGNNDRRQRILTYLERHCGNDLALADLAGELDLSLSRTSHLVQQMFRRPFRELLQEARLARAKTLLLTSDEPASAIAGQVELGEACAFNRFFKRATGLPPGAWRQAQQSRDA